MRFLFFLWRASALIATGHVYSILARDLNTIHGRIGRLE
jgi:hypothetical protein